MKKKYKRYRKKEQRMKIKIEEEEKQGWKKKLEKREKKKAHNQYSIGMVINFLTNQKLKLIVKQITAYIK